MMSHRFSLLMFASITLAISPSYLRAGYYPTVTEVNLGPVPLDLYSSASSNASLGYPLPNCPGAYTIHDCYKYFFQTSPNNYVAQGVTGVRFMFSTGPTGGFYSTAWDSYGNVLPAWTTNLTAFLADLRSYGISQVTPTPAIDGWGSTPISPGSIYDCTGTVPLVFYQARPFGFLPTNGYPDCQGVNNAYNSANGNPYFWGWTPTFNLANAIFASIQSAGIGMGEFDLENEINLDQFTVTARLFYDNVHGVDVLSQLRSLASSHGLNPYVITASTQWTAPTVSAYHCGSVYGDSALLLDQSTLLKTLAGGWSYFGFPYNPSILNGLVCGGSVGPSGGPPTMIQLPITYTNQPTINDIHAAPCVATGSGACNTSIDATATATTFYSDFWSYLYYRGMTGNIAMMGETSSNQYCDGETAPMATQNVNGYLASTLYSSHASGTTLRPWENDADSCYAAPVIINPPYTR
jgi:hypothetical protein